MKTSIRLLFLAAVTVTLVACNGHGSSAAVVSTLPFPLAQSIANFISSNVNIPLNLAGNLNGTAVTGTANYSAAAVGDTTFQGQQAFLRTVNITGSYISDGSTTSVPYASTTQIYYTTDYEPLGQNSSGYYCAFPENTTFPTSVIVDQSGTIGTANCYQDSSLSVSTGQLIADYEVRADTASTAIIVLIDNIRDTANTLQISNETQYRVDQNGNLTFLFNTITNHATSPPTVLTFTAQ